MNRLLYAIMGIRAAGKIIDWFQSANADGQITLSEMTSLVSDLARIFGLPVSIQTPASLVEPMKTASDVVGTIKMVSE